MLDNFIEALHESNSRLWRYYDYVAATFMWPAAISLLYIFFWHPFAVTLSWPLIPEDFNSIIMGCVFLVFITTLSIDRIRYSFTKDPMDKPIRIWHRSFREIFASRRTRKGSGEPSTNRDTRNCETATKKDECGTGNELQNAIASSISRTEKVSMFTRIAMKVRDGEGRVWRNYGKWSFLIHNGILFLVLSLAFWYGFAPKFNFPEIPDRVMIMLIGHLLFLLFIFQKILLAIDRAKYRLTGDPSDDPFSKWH